MTEMRHGMNTIDMPTKEDKVMANETERILMERDGLTREEAREEMKYALEELEAGNYSAMQEVLGLEDDYIFDLL